MPLTADEAFKVGFLMKCAENGLSPDESHDLIRRAFDKRAILGIGPALKWLYGKGESLAGKGWDLGTKLVPLGANFGLAAAVGVPVAGGIGAGYLLAKANEPAGELVERAKHEELVGEYERLADEARRKAKEKRLIRAAQRRPGISAPS